MREGFLRLVLAGGVIALALTELLGAVGMLHRWPLAIAWTALILVATWRWGRLPRPRWPGWLDALMIGAIGIIAAIVLVVALLSPPNTADAMGYHMPRVVYWSQAGSVAFFPVHYLPQVTQPPLAEYFILHTYILSGGDHFANLVQCFAFFASTIAASTIAADLGAGRRGQVLAALFAATLPNGILQASGVKNDCVLSLWLALAAHFALVHLRESRLRDLAATGVALGLAILTKNTAYLFGPVLLACLWVSFVRSPRRLARAAAVVVACVVAINGLHYARNYTLSGSILGPRTAEGDDGHPQLRFTPDVITLRGAASNLLRFSTEHLGARSTEWNDDVYRAVVRAHQWLGVDLHDPATTWLDVRFEPPRNSNHEANASNRLHLIGLLVAPALILAVRRERVSRLLLSVALALGFVVFCVALRWQPFTIRLQLPLFVLGSGLLGAVLADIPRPVMHVIAALLLLDGARLPLIENWVRPLRGERSLFRTSREDNYFADTTRYAKRDEYREAVRRTIAARCLRVGIDNSRFHLEYPFQALVLAADPGVRFQHSGLGVPGFTPCAVFCLDCAGDRAKIEQHRDAGEAITVGRSLLFLRRY